jgi:hypothetical protein
MTYAIERILCAAAWGWAAVLLAVQLARALARRQPDYAVAAASAARGALYNVTVAMSPLHKETARRHPLKFGAGVLLHAGVALALGQTAWLLISPAASVPYPRFVAGVLGAAALAGGYLLGRRVVSPALRALSAPDDVVAATATVAYVALTAAYELAWVSPGVFLVAAAAFAFYLPLGKLRHLLFCPASRLELGARLGRRGVFPPSREGEASRG